MGKESKLQRYVGFVRAKYGHHSCIVFDGYEKRPSTKDQEIFKSVILLKLLSTSIFFSHLKVDGQTVHQSTGDADTMIVCCALQYANQGTEVTVVADDTDVLVLS